jgi:phage terminase large subunit GpA-like protein
MQRFFPGGSVKVISAKAPRNLRRHTARCVYADEVDAMECVEDDPLMLAAWHTMTFRNRKVVSGSSPPLESTSLVLPPVRGKRQARVRDRVRAEPIGLRRIPEAALILTPGADIQSDRIELVSTAWDKAGCCYVLAHETLWGPTDENEVWVDLDDALKRRFAHPLGGQLRYDAAAVDCGNNFDRVLAFTGPRLSRKIIGVKGGGLR